MKLKEINVRDPFILLHEGRYYLFGSRAGEREKCQKGFDCYISDNLEDFSEPIPAFSYYEGFFCKSEYWAPEVHFYNGKFYMFATFHPENEMRGTFILVSDKPEGPYKMHSERITPSDWMCLDGTLYVEDGVPYMVFCHEWVQTGNGTVCGIELSKDLKKAVGEPFLMFDAKSGPWVGNINGGENYVTDGPFMVKRVDKLLCLWSSFGKCGFEGGYAVGLTESESGSIKGPWVHKEAPLYDKDGGHGMLFKTKEGEELFAFHAPNRPAGAERPHFIKLDI